MSTRVLLLGFAPWSDETRGIVVAENPARLAAAQSARLLVADGLEAEALAVEVSAAGVVAAVDEAERRGAGLVLALGQTPAGPRVERWGRVPSPLRPATGDDAGPWLLAPDADALVELLEGCADDAALLEPWRVSDDAGAYYCDQLCVELARLARRTGAVTRFLHVTAIDGCTADVREARVALYARQVSRLVAHLTARARRVA
jgi:pyrrolidone-carboxylate peptidase